MAKVMNYVMVKISVFSQFPMKTHLEHIEKLHK